MSFLKEIRTHLAAFDSKAKTEIEGFIQHLEAIYAEHQVVALSHAHKSSVPPTKPDSAVQAAPVAAISPIQQQVIAAAQAAQAAAPVVAPVVDVVAPVVDVVAPVVAPVVDVVAVTTTEPLVLAPTPIAATVSE